MKTWQNLMNTFRWELRQNNTQVGMGARQKDNDVVIHHLLIVGSSIRPAPERSCWDPRRLPRPLPSKSLLVCSSLYLTTEKVNLMYVDSWLGMVATFGSGLWMDKSLRCAGLRCAAQCRKSQSFVISWETSSPIKFWVWMPLNSVQNPRDGWRPQVENTQTATSVTHA